MQRLAQDHLRDMFVFKNLGRKFSARVKLYDKEGGTSVKEKKILFIYIMISIVALGLEFKMSHYISDQEKKQTIENQFKKKHAMQITPKQITDLFDAKESILYTKRDRNKIVKINVKKQGILLIRMHEYYDRKKQSAEVLNDQNKKQQENYGDGVFEYSYVMPVKKGDNYKLRILPQVDHLLVTVYLVKDNEKRLYRGKAYLQIGDGKQSEKILEGNEATDLTFQSWSELKNKKFKVTILKKEGENWKIKKKIDILKYKKYSYSSYNEKGKYKILINAPKSVIYSIFTF